MTSLDTSRTPTPRTDGSEPQGSESHHSSTPAPREFVIERESADPARSSPDPMQGTDRYRLMMPYLDRL